MNSLKNYMNPMEPKMDDLHKLANMRMPFGKHKGWRLVDLPEPYIVWFHSNGFPQGEIGSLLAQLYEIKLNGLEYLLEPLKESDEDNYR